MTLRGVRAMTLFLASTSNCLSLWTMHLAYAVCDAEGSYECISTTVFMSMYDYQFLCQDVKGGRGSRA